MRFESDFCWQSWTLRLFMVACHLSPWLVPALLLIHFLPTSLSKSTKSFQARFVARSLFPPLPTLLWCQHISLPNYIQNPGTITLLEEGNITYSETNKLASLKTRLFQNYDPLNQSITGVEFRPTRSVAKNKRLIKPKIGRISLARHEDLVQACICQIIAKDGLNLHKVVPVTKLILGDASRH